MDVTILSFINLFLFLGGEILFNVVLIGYYKKEGRSSVSTLYT